MRHRTKSLITPAGHAVEVDSGIADMVEAMWALDIVTLQSCESMDGRTWIVLADICHLEVLLDAVGPTALFERLADWEVAAPYTPDDPDLWRYHLGPYPLEEETRQGWGFGVTVEFPPTDVQAVTAALLEHSERLAE